MNGLGLCAGIGGFELGLKPFGVEPVCFVEWTPFCQQILHKHWPDVPIWDDVKSFPGSEWQGRVDIVTAGFPCQPWSVAGKQKGIKDERWLWPDVMRVVRDVRPRIVFLENVPGLLSPQGLETVLADLARSGFDAEWDLFRASDVGAPHRRERIFILAYSQEYRLERGWMARFEDGLVAGATSWLEDADGLSERESEQREEVPGRTSKTLPDTNHVQFGQNKEWRPIRRRNASGPGYPPLPDDVEGWRIWNGPQPGLRRGADGTADQVERTSCLGNAVVPDQASLAFATLVRRVGPGNAHLKPAPTRQEPPASPDGGGR